MVSKDQEKTLNYFVEKYNLDLTGKLPIEVPNVGRDILGHWFKDLGFRVGAEIGVEKGIFSKIMLLPNPNLELFCIDAWTPYADYRCWMNTEQTAQNYYEAQARLKQFPNVHFVKSFSSKAVKKFKDNSLDFVYIDANHDLPWCMDDIMWWHEKVRPGGIVAGHDYIRTHRDKPSRCYVRDAVHWFTTLKPVTPWFTIGREAKIEGEVRDNNRSFFWVKG